ncbi:hypothetical protein [Streptomyces showdoensis]|uniref:hypothetical protein n=1 Tax=Streptomyces showdoensis TaxID=68268 RepID=UPI0031E83289
MVEPAGPGYHRWSAGTAEEGAAVRAGSTNDHAKDGDGRAATGHERIVPTRWSGLRATWSAARRGGAAVLPNRCSRVRTERARHFEYVDHQK